MSYVSEVLADSPIGYWRLDEISGTSFADTSGNNRTATIAGSPTLNQFAATASMGGKSSTFGSGQYATVPDDAGLSITGAFTIEAWVNPTSSASERYILEKYTNPGYHGYALRMNGMTPRAHILYGTNYTTLNATIALTAGTWNHVVVTYDLSVFRIYINGAPAGSLNTTTSPTDGASSLKIAARGDDANAQGIGGLDDIALYNTALSQARITAHFDASYPPLTRYQSEVLTDYPLAYWSMDDTTGTQMTDTGGSERHGVYEGSGYVLGQSPLLTSGNGTSVSTTQDGVGRVAVSSWMNVATAVSLECWFKTASNSTMGLAGRSNGGAWGTANNNTARVYIDNGQLIFQVFDTAHNPGFTLSSPASTYADNAAHHVAGSWNGTTARLYVDGAQVASTTASFSIATSSSLDFYVGSMATNYIFVGSIDEVAYYDRELTADRVMAHYNVGSMLNPATLSDVVLWLRAKDLGAGGASVTTWPDQSGLGHDGTSTGTAPTVALASTPRAGKSVRFGGSGHFTLGSVVSSSSAGELWMVVKTDGGTGPSSWDFGNDTSQQSHYPWSGAVYDDAITNSRRSFTPTLPITSWRVYRVRNNGTVWVASLDGQTQLSVNGLPVAWPATFRLGASSGGAGFQGNIAEVLLRTTVADAQESDAILNYFQREHVSAVTTLTIYAGYAEALAVASNPSRNVYASYSEAITNSTSIQRRLHGGYVEVLTPSTPRPLFSGWGLPL